LAKVTPPIFTDGAKPTGEDVFDVIYDLSTDVLNGRVEAANLELLDNRSITHPYLQRRSVSGAGMTAGTCSLDYFTDTVYNHSSGDPEQTAIDGMYLGAPTPETAAKGLFTPIPGASITFHLPFKAYVLLTWQVTWTSDSQIHDADGQTHVRLFVDGEKSNHCNVRRVGRTMFYSDSGASNDAQYSYLRDRYKSRYWSGHKWIIEPLNKGFHSASLRVIQGENVSQARVRARSMKYMFFKAKND
jgi:hypothetical protein